MEEMKNIGNGEDPNSLTTYEYFGMNILVCLPRSQLNCERILVILLL
jgi:hypothetical protein